MKLLTQSPKFAVTAVSFIALIAASSAHAQFAGSGSASTQSVSVGVTVDASIDITKDNDIEFGTVAAFTETGSNALLNISATGTVSATTDSNAFVYVVDDSSAQFGQITLTGIAPGATVNYHFFNDNLPTDGTDSWAIGTDGAGTAVWDITVDPGDGTPVANNDIDDDENNTFTADGDVATDAVIAIGMTLSTDPATDKLMNDGAYAGSFTVTVGY